VANQSIDAVPLLSFGANDLVRLRVLPAAELCSRPTGERFDPQPHLAQWRHTSRSRRERVADIAGTCFRSWLDRRVLASSPSRTRRKNGEPGGSRLNAPSLGLHSLTGWWKSGSKMGEQVTCFARARWTISMADRESKMDNQHG